MTAHQPDIVSPVGVIAGGGVLPFAVARSLRARGINSFFYALKGFCDPDRVQEFPHVWFPIGRFGRMMGSMRSKGIRDIVFIGSLVRPGLSDVRLDWTTIRLIPRVVAALRGGDDHLLSATAGMFEENGFRLVGIKDVAPELLMPEGAITRRAPDVDMQADIAMGRELLAALGPYDVGQAVVVIDGHAVGVEDIEGTDGLLARVARLRGEGRIRARAGRGVLVKAPKVGQDLRFDLPTLGPKTVAGLTAAKLAGAGIVAGQSLIADPQIMIAEADKAGVFVVGLPA